MCITAPGTITLVSKIADSFLILIQKEHRPSSELNGRNQQKNCEAAGTIKYL